MSKLLMLLLLFAGLGAQPSDKINFRNPSFEDSPGAGKSPKGWYSANQGSTPDIMPGAWEIQFPPQEGKTCLGLVIREDGTREDISQVLAETLPAGKCYSFTVYLAHASKYVGYNKPTRLRIFGAAQKGSAPELLATSPLIDHSDWRQYKFELSPKQAVRVLTFEIDYAPGVVFKYKGNLLIDNCSPLEKCIRA